jgi:hypothetical protein
MLRLLRLLSIVPVWGFRSRCDLLLEILALRQQLTVLRRLHPQPRFAPSDRLFWVMLRRLWPGWKHALILVQPETVVRWHRAGFKLYWTWLSRHRTRVGRRCVSIELRELLFRMVAENCTDREVNWTGSTRPVDRSVTLIYWEVSISQASLISLHRRHWRSFLAFPGFLPHSSQ